MNCAPPALDQPKPSDRSPAAGLPGSRAPAEDSIDRSDAGSHRVPEQALSASPARKSAAPTRRDAGEAVNSFEEFLKTKNLFDMSLNALFEEKPPSREKKEAAPAEPRVAQAAPQEERVAPKLAPGLKFESRLTKNAIEYFKKKRNPGEASKRPGAPLHAAEHRSLRQDYSGTQQPGRLSPSISKGSDRSALKSQTDPPSSRKARAASPRLARRSPRETAPHYTAVRHEDGSVYTGFLLGELRQGRGLLELRDGSRYEGDWAAGKMAGTGTLTYAGGRVAYTGGFSDNRPHGLGTMHSSAPAPSTPRKKLDFRDFSDIESDWDFYEGVFVDGKKQGLGKLAFRNGDLFVGHFEEDKISGLGKFCSGAGTVLGFWEGNILIRRLN